MSESLAWPFGVVTITAIHQGGVAVIVRTIHSAGPPKRRSDPATLPLTLPSGRRLGAVRLKKLELPP